MVRELELKHQVICKFLAPFLFDRFDHTRTPALSCTSPQMRWLKFVEMKFSVKHFLSHCWKHSFYSQIANRIIPAYRSFPSVARPTKMKAGTIRYNPRTADFLVCRLGNLRTTEPCKTAITTPVVRNIFA